jgi:fumarylacetoacetase
VPVRCHHGARVSGFGPELLPYGVFHTPGTAPRVGARLGDGVLDLAALAAAGSLDEDPALFAQPALNAFMAAGPETWARVRAALTALAQGVDAEPATTPLAGVELRLPFAVADYVDFFSSEAHARRAGGILRPDSADPLLPNWRHLPVGYHGRAGTVVVSGTPVRRPHGQRPGPDGPTYGPSERLDVELELGYVVGVPSAHGEPVGVGDALDHVFGAVLVNDWSARDLQAWEAQPLGPFLAKSFATSISAWVTPLEALAARRVPAPAQDPEPVTYLREEPWAYDLALELELAGTVLARTNARDLYWSPAQQVAHLTVNGASLRTGDLLATGTISGAADDARACLLELTRNGAEPVTLDDGSRRAYLADGDEVVLRGDMLAEVRGTII